MDEYISREAVLEHLNKCKEDPLFDPDMARICFAMSVFIENMQAANVQPAPQWISVKERLPNHYEEVLVVSKLENIVYFAWYDADISMFMGHGHMWTTREVTHWMPLPEPPKDGDAK